MDRNSSGPTDLRQLGTWRSGGESPSFPGSGDARRLLEVVDRTPTGVGCTLVRVRLCASDRRTLVRVREHLLGEEPIVATSIGRDAGPDDPETFEILVVPDCDPVTVGRAIADVEDVVGVAATAFESLDPGGRAVEEAGEREDTAGASRSVVDDAFADLKASAGMDSGESLLGTIDRTGLGEDDVIDRHGMVDERIDQVDSTTLGTSAAADVDGLEVLEETGPGSATSGRPRAGEDLEPDSPAGNGNEGLRSARRAHSNGTARSSTNGTPDPSANAELPTGRREADRSIRDSNGGGEPRGPDPVSERGDLDERLDRLEGRLSNLETVLDDGDRRAGPGNQQEDGGDHAAAAELEERLASLEATVAELEQWQRRVRDALIGDPSRAE